MKNLRSSIYTLATLLGTVFTLSAQTLTWISPAGQTEPYQVPSGTEITVQWYYFDAPPTLMFTSDEEPDYAPWQFSPNPDWSQHTNWVDNGDGTFNFTVTILENTWVFGGYQSFSGYAYSNAIFVEVVSGVELTHRTI